MQMFPLVGRGHCQQESGSLYFAMWRCGVGAPHGHTDPRATKHCCLRPLLLLPENLVMKSAFPKHLSITLLLHIWKPYFLITKLSCPVSITSTLYVWNLSWVEEKNGGGNLGEGTKEVQTGLIRLGLFGGPWKVPEARARLVWAIKAHIRLE